MSGSADQKSVHSAFWFIQALILGLFIESIISDLMREIVEEPAVTVQSVFLSVLLFFSVVFAIELFYASKYVEARSDLGQVLSHLFLTFSIFPLIFVSELYSAPITNKNLINSISLGLIFFFIMYAFVRIVDFFTYNKEKKSHEKIVNKTKRMGFTYILIIAVLFIVFFTNIIMNIRSFSVVVFSVMFLYYFMAYLFPKVSNTYS